MAYKLIVTKHADELLDSVMIAGIFHQLENYWKKL